MDKIMLVLVRYEKSVNKRFKSRINAKTDLMKPETKMNNEFQIGRLKKELEEVRSAIDLRKREIAEQGGSECTDSTTLLKVNG